MEDMTDPGSEINWFWFREQCLNRLSRKQPLFMNIYFSGLTLFCYWWVIGSCDEFGKQTDYQRYRLNLVESGRGCAYFLLRWAYSIVACSIWCYGPYISWSHPLLHATWHSFGVGEALPSDEARGTIGMMFRQWAWWWFVGTSVICSISLPRALSSQWLIPSLFPWIYLQRKRF